MSFEMRQVAKCDACGHVWLPGGEAPRRCAKCKATKWNAAGVKPSSEVSAVDDGLEAIEIRVLPGDRRQVEFMAKQAKQCLTDFIMCRVWGEVAEVPPAPAHIEEGGPAPAGDRASRLRAALSIPGVRLGAASDTGAAEVFSVEGARRSVPLDGGQFVQSAVVPAAKPRRAFNLCRPRWYALVDQGDWWQLLRDVETGQVWVNASGNAQEFEGEEAARAFIASRS